MMENLTRKQKFRPMREGSWDRSGGNNDWRPIKSGETLVMAEMDGPGKIVHWWCTVGGEGVEMYNRMLVLRFYWDDEKEPSVEAPLGDFFGSGHGMEVDCLSLPITAVHNGTGRNCWFEMPFRKKARMTITNEADKDIRAFYWNVDWQKHDEIPDDAMYFHAQYRQEYPTARGRDYSILEAQGEGHLTGVVLSVEKALVPGWFGEGDEKIYIDGEEHPSIWGTGTEDYFLTAWCPEVHHSAYAGCSIWQHCKHPGDKMTCYRFHVKDPVPFEKSIKVDIEHAWTVENKEFEDYYSSVAYWYQSEPHKPFDRFPSAEERRARWPENLTYDEHWKKGSPEGGY
ncbi:MAG TPA: DUF2961 domain-containing protein [Clostridia bacterium]|nr:DUF2961 domain-containing protein [Clostridia bacterium]